MVIGKSQEYMRGRTADATAAIVDATDQTEELATAEEILKAAQDALKQSMSELNLFISGPVKKENQNYIDKQVEISDKLSEVTARIDELNGKKYLTKQQKEELAHAQG